ncbi:MAG: scyllo-inositol 2-dehydrogenase (NAD(+)) [Ignavibacteria bacterium]|nr:scyllo-inositol 2-dehydrogenase (NAD(+)) [Ignavibacteria bacterium]
MHSKISWGKNYTKHKMTDFSIAVVGCGKWGMNHVKTACKLFGDKLKYCIDSADKEKAVKDISGSIIFSEDISKVIEDADVKGVIVSTPAETHFEITKKLLNAGKHVLVEKPITLKSEEAVILNDLAISKRLILMVGHLLLYHPAVLKIKELLDEGRLGKLQYIYSNRLNLGTVRTEENILWSFAPHDISVIQFLTGDIPEKVNATGSVFLTKNIQDTTLTVMKFKNNIHAHIYVSWLHPFKEQRLVIIGDKSMIVFEDSLKDNKLKFYPKGIEMVNGIPVKRDEDFINIEFDSTSPLELEQKHFAECITQKKTPRSDGKNAIEVLETLERAQKELIKI